MISTDTSRLVLGIDTGGTYTDAALCRETAEGLQLVGSAKARTTKENLTIGIRNAVAGLDRTLLKDVIRVSLSTTLATNACVEDMGGEVRLVLITPDKPLERQAYLDYGLPEPEQIVFLPEKVNSQGVILERLTKDEIRERLAPVCRPGVCVAVSGLFSTRNPELELEAAEIAAELGAKVICGRDVAPNQLNYLRRAATALLNGRLQPVIRDFLESVKEAMQEFEMDVPIDIVRSDGSLMNHAFALEYPVETLLCGPAASVAGVMHLLGKSGPKNGQQEKHPATGMLQPDGAAIPQTAQTGGADIPQNYIIADIGGTTTDLSIVRNGQAVRTEEGVNIGSYRTCVQSVFVETLGLGGDTRLYADKSGRLALDNNRAVPLCVLAFEYPEIKAELREMLADPYTPVYIYEYRVLARTPQPEELAALNEKEKLLCEFLAERPRNIRDCAKVVGRDMYVFNSSHLEQMGLVRKGAFALTDVLHLEGEFRAFDVEASLLGARIFSDFLKMDVEEVCRKGRELAVFRLYRAIIRMCLHQDNPKLRQMDEAGIDRMIEAAFYGGKLMNTAFRLPVSLVGVGAAAQAFLPDAGEKLGTEVILPDAAPVANAVGAAASVVRAEVRMEIHMDREEAKPRYYIVGSSDSRLFESYEEVIAEAGRLAEKAAAELARARGILGPLKITVTDERNLLEMDSVYGAQSFDFGGAVVASAEAEVSTDVKGI